MLTFFREHSRIIGKMILNQFGAAFLGILLFLAVSTADTDSLYLLVSIFSVLFMLFLDYTELWEEGAKSRIRVDAGRAAYRPVTGLLIGLLASIPNILLGLVHVVTYFLSSLDGPFAWEWAGNWNAFNNILMRIWQGMYLGITQTVGNNSPLVFLLIPIPMILICFFGYWVGLQNRRIYGVFTPKPKTKPGTMHHKD